MPRGTRARLSVGAIIGVLVAALALWAGVSVGAAHTHRAPRRAHAAIVDGTTITSLSQAPWTAVIAGVNSEGGYGCDGAILDATHILTAAHCLVDPKTFAAVPNIDLAVFAGVTNLASITHSTPVYGVSGTRVDPSYDASLTTDVGVFDGYDVGVITLSTPITPLGGAGQPQAISLAPSPPAPGTSASVAGFGVEMAGATESTEPDGTLNQLGFTFAPAGECVPVVNAVVGCMSSSTGSACFGDSGSAVTTTSGTPAIIGVVNAGLPDANGNSCEPGSIALVSKVSVPEIEDFIHNMADPDPPAPQDQGDETCSPASPQVGQAITCYPGTWSGSPTFAYEFVDDATGAVLEQGSTSYTPTQGDVGRLVNFVVSATNTGGTAYARVGEETAVTAAQAVSTTTSTTTTSSATTTTAAPKPKPKPATLHLVATPGRVRPGGRVGLRITLDSGSALNQARVCVAVPAHASVTAAAGAHVKGGQACWTVSLRGNSARLLSLVLKVSKGQRKGTVTLSAKASVGAAHELTAQTRLTVAS